MFNNDNSNLDEDKIRKAIEDAEPPPGTMEWAAMIVHRYEPQISGTSADITRVYELPYVEAAAIFSIEDAGRYERLKKLLKGRGVGIQNWERRVREREHQIRDERKAEARGAAQQHTRARKVPSNAAAPVWTPLESKCQQPVDGKDLLRDLLNAIRGFIYLEEEKAIIAALWVLFTWIFEKCAETNPYLRVVSPEQKCGKSTLLKILRYLVRAGWYISSSTKSSLVRKAQTGRVTPLIDEGDAFLHENEEMRNVLDAASDPDTANVALSIKRGDEWVPADIDVFLPICIASIKELRGMGTVEDRSIQLWLKRATNAERKVLTKARRRTMKQTLEPIADRCARWAMDNADKLAGMRPAIDFEDGRDEDKWEPLIGIADHIDVEWGKRVREIAANMIGKSPAEDQSLAIRLLVDIKGLFDEKRKRRDSNADRFASQTLCNALIALLDRPWRALPAGKGREPKPITQLRLALMLKDFGIRPHNIRIGADETPKGYERHDFEDAWQRYVAEEEVDKKKANKKASKEGKKPDDETSAEGEKPAAVRPPKPNNDPSFNSTSANFGDPKRHNATTLGREGESGDFQSATEAACGGSKNGTSAYGENECGGVAGQNSENEEISEKEGSTNTPTCPLGCNSSTGCQAPDACRKAERFTVDDGIIDGGIPAFITNAAKAALRARGYSDEQIAKLRPAEALKILRSVNPEAVQPGTNDTGGAKTAKDDAKTPRKPRPSGEGRPAQADSEGPPAAQAAGTDSSSTTPDDLPSDQRAARAVLQQKLQEALRRANRRVL